MTLQSHRQGGVALKKSINAWCFPADFTLEKIFALAAECGYDTLELNMAEEEGAYLRLGMGPADWEPIKALSVKYKVAISSVSTSLHWRYPLTDDDSAKREKGAQIVKEMLDAAAYFGCDTVLVVPGAVTEQVSYVTAYRRALEAMKALRGYAEEKKVAIGVENVWNKFLLSPMEMARFIDEADSDYIGAYFDAGNVLQFSYPEHWVEALGKRIKKVHVKDFDAKVGNMSGFRNLLQGSLNWDRLVAALKTADYDGPLTAELSPYNTNPSQLVRDTSAALDYILRRLI
jgi:hexulose-6-phosphate isomerase